MKNFKKFNIFFVENPNGLHAEMMLLRRILIKLHLKTELITLGISKLCCKLCAAGLFAVQGTFQTEINFRGRHGNFYYGWKPSNTLLINEEHIFKKFDRKTGFSSLQQT
ncbi:MAG: hypothetical protein H0U27_05415 [Nitrosopumilus sp.]|nr:hypothetical protein [Nitrosopumilus sp.]